MSVEQSMLAVSAAGSVALLSAVHSFSESRLLTLLWMSHGSHGTQDMVGAFCILIRLVIVGYLLVLGHFRFTVLLFSLGTYPDIYEQVSSLEVLSLTKLVTHKQSKSCQNRAGSF